MGGNLNYIKSLDGLRSLGALSIIVAHWQFAFPKFPVAWEWLQMFFIMSGFLITRILLNEKERRDNFKGYMSNFMMKRVYRIFPLFFAYLFFFLILRWAFSDIKFIAHHTRELEYNGIWLFTYLYNFAGIFNVLRDVPYQQTEPFAHLWSLAVEEQFYFIFPFVVYFLSKKNLKIVLIIMMIVPQLLRMFSLPILQEMNSDDVWVARTLFQNTIFQFDALAYGAALAVFDLRKIKNPRKWTFIILFFVLVIYAINGILVSKNGLTVTNHLGETITFEKVPFMLWVKYNGIPEVLTQYGRHTYNIFIINILCFFLVLSSIRDQPASRRILENPIIVYLGKISYGLYVYHFAIMIFFIQFIKKIVPRSVIAENILLQTLFFILYMSILILFSHLSFKYFEGYFLRLKSKLK